MNADPVARMRDGMDNNVYVLLDTSKLTEFAELAI